jgi:Putative zinc-finger
MAEARSRERALLRKALLSSCACATPLELGRLADGLLAQSEAARLRDHVSTCSRCQTELMLLQDFENAAPRPDEEDAVGWISARLERRFSEARMGFSPVLPLHDAARPRRSVFTALNVGGFAVAAATLVAALLIGLRERRIPELAQPSLAAPTVLRSAGIETFSPAEDLDAAPRELRWEPQTAAASYSVQVMEVDHAELWSAETRDARIAVPLALRARMVPGKPLLWEVVAKDAAGKVIAWSGKKRFRVRR